MSAKEFERWRQFQKQEPIDDRANVRHPLAMLTAIFTNANKGANQAAKNTRDFLLYEENPENDNIDDLLLNNPEDW